MLSTGTKIQPNTIVRTANPSFGAGRPSDGKPVLRPETFREDLNRTRGVLDPKTTPHAPYFKPSKSHWNLIALLASVGSLFSVGSGISMMRQAPAPPALPPVVETRVLTPEETAMLETQREFNFRLKQFKDFTGSQLEAFRNESNFLLISGYFGDELMAKIAKDPGSLDAQKIKDLNLFPWAKSRDMAQEFTRFMLQSLAEKGIVPMKATPEDIQAVDVLGSFLDKNPNFRHMNLGERQNLAERLKLNYADHLKEHANHMPPSLFEDSFTLRMGRPAGLSAVQGHSFDENWSQEDLKTVFKVTVDHADALKDWSPEERAALLNRGNEIMDAAFAAKAPEAPVTTFVETLNESGLPLRLPLGVVGLALSLVVLLVRKLEEDRLEDSSLSYLGQPFKVPGKLLGRLKNPYHRFAPVSPEQAQLLVGTLNQAAVHADQLARSVQEARQGDPAIAGLYDELVGNHHVQTPTVETILQQTLQQVVQASFDKRRPLKDVLSGTTEIPELALAKALAVQLEVAAINGSFLTLLMPGGDVHGAKPRKLSMPELQAVLCDTILRAKALLLGQSIAGFHAKARYQERKALLDETDARMQALLTGQGTQPADAGNRLVALEREVTELKREVELLNHSMTSLTGLRAETLQLLSGLERKRLGLSMAQNQLAMKGTLTQLGALQARDKSIGVILGNDKALADLLVPDDMIAGDTVLGDDELLKIQARLLANRIDLLNTPASATSGS